MYIKYTSFAVKRLFNSSGPYCLLERRDPLLIPEFQSISGTAGA